VDGGWGHAPGIPGQNSARRPRRLRPERPHDTSRDVYFYIPKYLRAKSAVQDKIAFFRLQGSEAPHPQSARLSSLASKIIQISTRKNRSGVRFAVLPYFCTSLQRGRRENSRNGRVSYMSPHPIHPEPHRDQGLPHVRVGPVQLYDTCRRRLEGREELPETRDGDGFGHFGRFFCCWAFLVWWWVVLVTRFVSFVSSVRRTCVV